MKKELKTMMGVCNDTPAGASVKGTVEEGAWGMVMLLDEHKKEFADVHFSSEAGYYDDDGATEEGHIMAIVYFGEPFGDWVMVPHDWLRPATQNEIQAHQEFLDRE
jgi:hypothetical protein